MDQYVERTVLELRAARLRSGIAQSELAERLGTTQSAIARLEAAQTNPRLGTIQRYAESVGMRLVAVPAVPPPSLASTGDAVGAALRLGHIDDALRHVIQFLDDVKSMPPESRRAAIIEEPSPVDDIRWDALLAGMAEYVSQRFGFAVPGWASAPGRFLRRFWFVIEDVLGRPAPGLAAIAFARTPAAFANRGVFIDRDSLVSV